MHFDVPFGPVIGKVSLPEDKFKTVLALVEDLRAQKEKKLALLFQNILIMHGKLLNPYMHNKVQT